MSIHAADSSKASARPRRALVVAYHFPPQVGSSGLLRTLKYCRYLPERGWEPTVLTAHPWAYERVGASQLQEIPSQVRVIRAFALDTRKHLSVRGRYLRFSALPDRWVTWCLAAVPAGVLQIYKRGIDVIFTTYPIPTAVLIGYLLHQITGVPWVADFRDPMTEEDYPRDPRTRRMLRWLEKQAVRHAARLIFTARSTMQRYLERFPELSADKCLVISNGYDEADFRGLQPATGDAPLTRMRMQHSGLIYPEERNPLPFFKALARLKQEGRINASSLLVDLRACGDAERFQEMAGQLSIQDLVQFPPPLPYRESLQDSSQSDVLLLLQGESCNHQIPAKTYEYLRLGKPVLALTTETGDTASVLKECGGATIVDIADEEAIYRTLPQMLEAVRAGIHPLPDAGKVSKYSRESQAQELAQCLGEAIEIATAGAASDIKRSAAGS